MDHIKSTSFLIVSLLVVLNWTTFLVKAENTRTRNHRKFEEFYNKKGSFGEVVRDLDASEMLDLARGCAIFIDREGRSDVGWETLAYILLGYTEKAKQKSCVRKLLHVAENSEEHPVLRGEVLRFLVGGNGEVAIKPRQLLDIYELCVQIARRPNIAPYLRTRAVYGVGKARVIFRGVLSQDREYWESLKKRSADDAFKYRQIINGQVATSGNTVKYMKRLMGLINEGVRGMESIIRHNKKATACTKNAAVKSLGRIYGLPLEDDLDVVEVFRWAIKHRRYFPMRTQRLLVGIVMGKDMPVEKEMLSNAAKEMKKEAQAMNSRLDYLLKKINAD